MDQTMSNGPASVAAVRSPEVLFEVAEAAEDGYDARAFGYGIFTQREDWDELKAMVRDAVPCHFDDTEASSVIRL